MDSLDSFVSNLLRLGKVVFRDAPVIGSASPAALKILEEAFGDYRLEVAGPLIAFDPEAALEAAEHLRLACWSLVNRQERVESLKQRLTMRIKAASPAAHLSADLTLRYLPQVYRRAKSMDVDDPLVAILSRTLREWPLSGVLSDVEDEPDPAAILGFMEHPGLLLSYAERLQGQDRPSWRPPPGSPGDAYFALVAPGARRAASHE